VGWKMCAMPLIQKHDPEPSSNGPITNYLFAPRRTDEPWDTKTLSALFKRYSQQYIGVKFGVNGYRHICISWCRKSCQYTVLYDAGKGKVRAGVLTRSQGVGAVVWAMGVLLSLLARWLLLLKVPVSLFFRVNNYVYRYLGADKRTIAVLVQGVLVYGFWFNAEKDNKVQGLV